MRRLQRHRRQHRHRPSPAQHPPTRAQRPRQRGQGKPRTDRRAHVLLKKMLQEPRLSAIIPGVNVPEHLDENIKASYEREVPKSAEEDQAIRQCQEDFYANLAPHHQWLRKWEAI